MVTGTGKQRLTPPELAKLWGVCTEKVVRLIRSGQLRAINSAIDPKGKKPRYLIDPVDVEAFERARSTVPPPPEPKRRRKSAGVVEFF